VLILLPPSEGKRPVQRGTAVDLDTLHFDELTRLRRAVLKATVTLCSGEVAAARTALGIGASLVDEVVANRDLRRAPAAPAWQVYSGVLYDALDAGSMSAAVRRRLTAQVAIASALWGLVMAGDRIPAYRLSADATLPGIGALPAVWRAAVAGAIASVSGLLVDLRSSSYVACGPLPAEVHHRAVTVAVFQVAGGKRVIVSHHNKATKGLLVRALLEAGARPRTPEGFAGACAELGFATEFEQPAKGPARVAVHMR
jgi:cytoplasmic iron level regulating protein YaaA (DUF328/UPF0246 family)